MSGKLPTSLDTTCKTKSVGKLMRDIKDIFESDPALAGQMIDELERSDVPPVDRKERLMLNDLG